MYKSATLPLLEPETKRWLLYSLFDATDFKYSKASSNIVGSISDCLFPATVKYLFYSYKLYLIMVPLTEDLPFADTFSVCLESFLSSINFCKYQNLAK